MKRSLLALSFLVAASLPMVAVSDNVIRMTAPIPPSPLQDTWMPAEPAVGNWVVTTSSGCVDSPSRSALRAGDTVQYQSCNAVTSTRTIQPREYNPKQAAYRDAGPSTTESKTSSTLNQPRYLACRYNINGSPVSEWFSNGAGTTRATFNGVTLTAPPQNKYEYVTGGRTYVMGATMQAQGGSGSQSFSQNVICQVQPDVG
ncbi:hypothetical protein DV532_26330 (plasmid) [Pseudomonas sp. Leaf58]|nr:hypothetical protein DV532_26330 [Pseudomonas sp. Leaf58]